MPKSENCYAKVSRRPRILDTHTHTHNTTCLQAYDV